MVTAANDTRVRGLLATIRQRRDAGTVASAPVAAAVPVTTVAADTAGTAGNVVVQAEVMTFSPLSAGKAYDDPSAAGGKAALLSNNGSLSTTVSLPAFSSVVVRAKGDQFRGAPTMTVSLDGKVVYTTSVPATTWTDYTVAIAKPAGTYTLTVAFTNNARGWRGDRNLRVDQATLIAAASTVDPTPPPTTTPPSSDVPAFFPQANWLWTKIPSNPVLAANSPTWVSYLSAADKNQGANLYNYGVTMIPASAITSSTPRYDVKFTQPWGSDPFGTYTVPIPLGTKVPPGSDGHVAILDPTTGKAFGLWQAKFDSATNTWSASWGGITDLTGNGVDYGGTATATNLARYAGVVTAAEFSAAVAANTGLNHALFFSTDIAGPGFVAPATKSDGVNQAGVAVPMPEGYRVQLDPSINVDAIPGITPGEKVIAKTLQTYGAYAGDRGGARMGFIFEAVPGATSSNPGSVWTSAGLTWDYYDMNHIPWGNLAVLKNWNGTA